MSEEKYEEINSPKHYNHYSIEVIEMMVRLWGPEATSLFCEMNAFKYRMRMGTKPDVDIQQELDKEAWYLKMANLYRRPETVKNEGTLQ
jgi:hypothetical protein